MELLDYVRKHPDFREELAAPPYVLDITERDGYIFFAYTDHSNMVSPICKQANCAIIRFDADINNYICVNFPYEIPSGFDAVNVDWPSTYVMQLIDGLMVCVWYDNYEWHFSSPHCFDLLGIAAFRDMIIEACQGNIKSLTSVLQPTYCYTFTLTSPKYRYIVDYGPQTQLWYAACRNIIKLKEERMIPPLPTYIQFPRAFPNLNNPEIMAQLQQTSDKSAGYMCIDKRFYRCRMDGVWYDERAKFKRGPANVKDIVRAWKNKQLEQYMKFFPEDYTLVTQTMENVKIVANSLKYTYIQLSARYNFHIPRTVLDRRTAPLVRRYILTRINGFEVNNEMKWMQEEATVDEVCGALQTTSIIKAMAHVT